MFSYKVSPHFNKLILFLLFGFSSVLLFADDVGGIIDKEKSDYQAWLAHEDDLPPAILWPHDENGILLYDAEMDDDNVPTLCSNLALDQFTGVGRRPGSRNQSPINFVTAESRSLWADACLVRPDDSLMAVGPGTQSKVTINQIVLETTQKVDRVNPVTIAVGIFEDELTYKPILFSSDPSLLEGPNEYTVLSGSTISIHLSPWKQRLENEVQFFDEFDGLVYVSTASNLDAIVSLRKKDITLDDIGLQNEVVLMVKGDVVTTLFEERVEENKPTGHVSPLGWFDFNRDGFLDVIVEGDHHGCVYQQLFLGTESGLSFQEVPYHPCYMR